MDDLTEKKMKIKLKLYRKERTRESGGRGGRGDITSMSC